jgi:hypothetical protein
LVLAVGGGTAFWIIHNRSENGGLDAGAGIEPAEVTEASSWCDQVFGPHVVVTDSDGERWDMQAGAILPNAAELGPEEGLADPLKDKAEAVRALGGALEAIRMAADLERDEAGMAATFEAYEDKTNEVVEWAQDVLLHGSRAKVPKNGWYDEQMALIYWCYQDGYEFQTGKP